MRNLRLVLFLLMVFGAFAPAFAQEKPARLKVGIFDRPPFAAKDEDGRWGGLAVDLWEQISDKLDLPFDYVEVPLDQVIADLASGKLDLALGEVAITSERMRLVDFTQAYLVDHAAVAFPKGSHYPSFRQIYEELTQHGLLLILALMLVTLMAFSLILWFCERGVRQTHFGGKPIHGFGSAIWFGAVTMTTVGYGDKTPQSLWGRFLALLWMFFSIVLVSAFTGTVASSITVSRINNSLNRPTDLAHFINGVQKGSIGEELLRNFNISAQSYRSIEEGMEALAAGRITAFVADDISLRYLVKRHYENSLSVTPFASLNLRLAIAARPNLPQFDDIDVELVDITESDEWLHNVKRWLGNTQSVNL